MIVGLLTELVKGLSGLFTQKQNVDLEKYKVDGQVSEKALDVALQLEKARGEQQIADNANWSTRMIRPAIASALIFYIWAIVLDSTIWNSGTVQRLPGFVEEWFFIILTTYFTGRSVEKIADAILKRSK